MRGIGKHRKGKSREEVRLKGIIKHRKCRRKKIGRRSRGKVG